MQPFKSKLLQDPRPKQVSEKEPVAESRISKFKSGRLGETGAEYNRKVR